MSDRPAPLTTTDVYLGLVLDELQGMRADLAKRGGTSSDSKPAVKPAPAKKTTSKGRKPVDVDGL